MLSSDDSSPYESRWEEEEDSWKKSKRSSHRCSLCPYETTRKNNLHRHYVAMHEKSKSHECCGVVYGTTAALRDHRKSEHDRGYACAVCERLFCRRALLLRHMSVHNGVKELKCSRCSYATSHKSNLERHVSRVHPSFFQKKRFPCDLCDYATDRRRVLDRHRQRNHSSSDTPLRHISSVEKEAAETLLSIFHGVPERGGVIAWAGRNGEVTSPKDEDCKKSRLCAKPYKCPECQMLFCFQWDYLAHCQKSH